MPADQPILITGGAGFIGANLVARLAECVPDRDLIVADDFRTGSFENIVEAFERHALPPFVGRVLPIDLAENSPAQLIGDLRPSVVFHQAAITDTTVADEREMLHVNTATMRPMLEATAAVGGRLVYASSAATYGSPPQGDAHEPFPLEAAGRPNNVYGFSKWLMECEHSRFANERRAAGEAEPWVVGLRYFNVFGPCETRKGKMASMACQLARQVIAGGSPRLFEHGEQARDQIHVDDVVDANLAAAGLVDQADARSDPKPGVYNLGSGQTTSFAEVAESVLRGLGLTASERPIEYFPMPNSIRAFYQSFTCADMRQTEAGLGWSPSRVPGEAIAEYAAWLGSRSKAEVSA
ncbi:MAG: NAD-dependent epimerase/dehydratase family protein [Planctomycetota bacterium]